MTTLGEDGLPPLREVIAAHGLIARKGLGQNFILDLNLTRRIAREAGIAGANVYEVGPGPGGLTRALFAEGAVRVVAVERNRSRRHFETRTICKLSDPSQCAPQPHEH